MKIALSSAEEMKLLSPGLRLAKSLYDDLANQGAHNEGTQSLYRLLDK